MICYRWPITEMTGYEPKTTFWEDFTVAERVSGVAGVKDTFQNAFKSWKHDKEYITELVMVLNWKIHQWYNVDDDLANLYNKLWGEADSWCMDNLKGDDLKYFLQTTD